ncbi:MAG: hypothetical protein JHD16_09720 [Solirubrobacteraceae bacterium]|nr:hypothetical protein [Solirubrobacteraceae bacterium]
MRAPRLSRLRLARRADRTPGPAEAVTRFMLGSVLAIAVVVVGGFFAVGSIAIDEARHDSAERVKALGHLVEAAALSDGLLEGDEEARAELDDLVAATVISDSVLRVKIWSVDGTILYSDQPELIGSQFTLGADEIEALEEGHTEVELSDLSKPENRFERPANRLIEAYTPIRTPNGTPVLFEIYQRFSSVSADGDRLLTALAPTLLGGLAVLIVLQVPLAWSLARRLQRGAEEREALLGYAVEASDLERRRIAADLHDGVVQDLAGLAFGLAPVAKNAQGAGRAEDAAVLRATSSRLQQSVRDLRALLVEIHPPNLASTGLEAALGDLLSPLEADGITTTLNVEDGPPSVDDELLYRVARESVRNAAAHAAATAVWVTVTRNVPPGVRAAITIRDDGRGFVPERRDEAERDGHVGLALLAGLVEHAGGALTVTSQPGAGTTVHAEVPAP